MADDRFNDDPTATYRGYRRQALYCLFRLFDEAVPKNYVVHPEGDEDLALYDEKNQLLEVVQVKDFTDNLTASKFKPTFYERISRYCRPGSSIRVSIVSFGPVGPELRAALDNTVPTPDRVLRTLTTICGSEGVGGSSQTVIGITEDVAKNILAHLELIEVEEVDLTRAIMARLHKTVTAGDPARAFENLMWWLMTSAERQQKLTRSIITDKLNQIGTFLSQRAAFNHEWNTSIIPIQAESDCQRDRQTLEREFFLGGRVRINHIVAGFDVPRIRLLNRIHESFEAERVVIVRAASGQGKTTLAYRYLLDVAPHDFRFEALKPSDVQHARRMATAIEGHFNVLGVPTLVYVDVRPGDTLWVEFVRELSANPGIRVLVTIREEDWFRSRVRLDDFRFNDLQIEFDEASGREMYGLLRNRTPDATYLDFEDAWTRLGVRKTLFEFVYIITHSESLAAKIDGQIAALQDEAAAGHISSNEMRLLRLVTVASAFESRVELSSLIERCKIVEPQRTLERFNNEFLVRTSDDRRHVEGFHSVRSNLMTLRLMDEWNSWTAVALDLLPLLDEKDLEVFLLCSFSRRHEARNELRAALRDFRPKTWAGIRGICNALQWLGVAEYTSDNSDLINKVRRAFSGGWWFALDWDLAHVAKDGFDVFGALRGTSREADMAAEMSPSLRAMQTDKNKVFDYFRDWIAKVDPLPDPPTSVSDFIALAEVMYWVGHLKIDAPIGTWMTDEQLERAFNELPIHLFADVASACRAIAGSTYMSWYQKNRARLDERLRRQTRILALVEEDSCLVAHYIIDLDRQASVVKTQVTDQSNTDVEVNDLSVERVEIVSRCVPSYKQYGAEGYGHRMSLIQLSGDDSIKRIAVENLPIHWLPRFNAMAKGLAEHRFRPRTWDGYFQASRSMRQRVIKCLDDLRNALERSRISQTFALRDMETWDICKAEVNGDFFLPSTAVDEWGVVSEFRSKRLSEQGERRFTTVTRLESYNRTVTDYTSSVGNFMRQVIDTLVLLPPLRNALSDVARQAILKKANEIGVKENSIRLSVVNGIDACIALRKLQQCEASLFEDGNEYRPSTEYQKSEITSFDKTVRKWCSFVYPEQVNLPTKNGHTRRGADDLMECLRPVRNRIAGALKKLAAIGIYAEIISEDVKWDDDSALWIAVDTMHPLHTLVAVDRLWRTLCETCESDQNKIVRMKAFDLYWSRIIFVPLIQGKSLEKQAYPHMKGITYSNADDIEKLSWRLRPELIPSNAWEQLGLAAWDQLYKWEVYDHFAAAYSVLFYHIDHIADFVRCKVCLDDLGESIFEEYRLYEVERMQPLLQETFDSLAGALETLPDWTDDLMQSRPNLFDCAQMMIQMQDVVVPSKSSEGRFEMTMDELAQWRDRLKVGFELVGQARYLWIADSLGCERYVASD